jgi:hypothetical protein
MPGLNSRGEGLLIEKSRPFRRALPLLALALLTACTSGPGATATPASAPPPPATATAASAPETDTPEPTHVIPTAIPTIALPPPPTAPPAANGVDETQLTAIYSLVAHDLVPRPAPPYLAIAPTAAQGELLDTPAPDRPIPPGLIGALSDLSTTIELTSFMEAIGPLESGGRVRNDGMFLTFGVVEPDESAGPNGVALYASFYRASDDATGYRYRLFREGTQWVIKDKTQTWDH